jgi:SAM-dependent methyltransferase
LQNAKAYLNTVGHVCSYVDAAKKIDWVRLLPRDADVLDLGCGGGWLTAMLSRVDSVKTVYALDSSQHFLHKLLPQVMTLMQGNSEKVVTLEAMFQPLLFEDGHLDAIVASSALHHAENLELVLKESRRALKPGGLLFILNETPRPGWRFLVSAFAASTRILRNLAVRRYMSRSPAISSSGYLYDPDLGDRDYPLWYWEEAVKRAGFVIEDVLNTGMPTVKGSKGRPLIHFVCRAV